MVLFIDTAQQGQALSASAASGGVVASATPTFGPDGEALRVQVHPGVDALLYLLCMLAVVLMSPELAGLRTGEGGARHSAPLPAPPDPYGH